MTIENHALKCFEPPNVDICAVFIVKIFFFYGRVDICMNCPFFILNIHASLWSSRVGWHSLCSLSHPSLLLQRVRIYSGLLSRAFTTQQSFTSITSQHTHTHTLKGSVSVTSVLSYQPCEEQWGRTFNVLGPLYYGLQ